MTTRDVLTFAVWCCSWANADAPLPTFAEWKEAYLDSEDADILAVLTDCQEMADEILMAIYGFR